MEKAALLKLLEVLGEKAPSTYLFDQASSTMELAKELLESDDKFSQHYVAGNSANGYLVIAQTQSSGRGRSGKTWHSPEGHGLYFTLAALVEKEAEQTLGLSLAVGASICESLKKHQIPSGLKWPNDIIILPENAKEFRKLGGVLIETTISGSKTKAIFVGVGLNVSNIDFPDDILGISISQLTKKEFSSAEILAILLPGLCEDLDRFFRQGFGAFRNTWRKHSLIFNSRAKLVTAEETVECKLEDIASDGALVVKVNDKLRNIYSGELTQILPAQQKTLSIAQTIDQYIANCFTEISEQERSEILDSLNDDSELEEELVAEEEVSTTTNLSALIKEMKLGAKVKLGLLGNLTARAILIRENSRQIRQAVMKNPRLTESEVIEFAKNSNLDKQVFQMIANDNNWMKAYSIQVAIISNPKTPMDISIRWIKYLKDKELRILSKSKSIPSSLVNQIRKLVELRNKKPGGGH